MSTKGKRDKKASKVQQQSKTHGKPNPNTEASHIDNVKDVEPLIQSAISNMFFDGNGLVRGDAVAKLDALLGEIDNRQVNRSAIASNLKQALRWLLGLILLSLVISIVGILWFALCVKQWPSNATILIAAFSLLGILTWVMIYGVKFLNKTDTYNMFILALTIISLALSIFSLVR